MSAFLDYLKGGLLRPSPEVKIAHPPTWNHVLYDRTVVFPEIVAKSGGELSVATGGELGTLRRLQAEWDKWAKAVGLDGQAARCAAQAAWASQVAGGLAYDPLGFISETEASERFTYRKAVVEEHLRPLRDEGRPICLAVLKRLPDAVSKLVPAVEASEAPAQAHAAARGETWVPCQWLRLLWESPEEVAAQIERVQDSVQAGRELSIPQMLCNAIEL